MARSKSSAEPRQKAGGAGAQPGKTVSLDHIDTMMRQAYDQVRTHLDEVEGQLRELETTRKQLSDRVYQLELGLGLRDVSELKHDEDAPEVEEEAETKPEAEAPQREAAAAQPAKGTRGKRSARTGKRAAKAAPAAEPARKGRAAGASRKRRRGGLWDDVQEVMKNRGAMQASKVIDALVADKGYEDTDKVRTRVYNSLGRWAREGKLTKSARGVYKL